MAYLLVRVYICFWSEVFRFWGGWVSRNPNIVQILKVYTYFGPSLISACFADTVILKKAINLGPPDGLCDVYIFYGDLVNHKDVYDRCNDQDLSYAQIGTQAKYDVRHQTC